MPNSRSNRSPTSFAAGLSLVPLVWPKAWAAMLRMLTVLISTLAVRSAGLWQDSRPKRLKWIASIAVAMRVLDESSQADRCDPDPHCSQLRVPGHLPTPIGVKRVHTRFRWTSVSANGLDATHTAHATVPIVRRSKLLLAPGAGPSSHAAISTLHSRSTTQAPTQRRSWDGLG